MDPGVGGSSPPSCTIPSLFLRNTRRFSRPLRPAVDGPSSRKRIALIIIRTSIDNAPGRALAFRAMVPLPGDLQGNAVRGPCPNSAAAPATVGGEFSRLFAPLARERPGRRTGERSSREPGDLPSLSPRRESGNGVFSGPARAHARSVQTLSFSALAWIRSRTGNGVSCS